ncbi:hypothetical protein ACFVFS_34535 [Kitasatospora sp. NPDC057692]|uniref:hypothetical protein n=1 Tax=Kitasatospora sp. NPDC057692 TaxID=3346215 RepID=UPI003696692E
MAAIRDRNADAGFPKWPPTRAANALIRKQAARFAREERTPKSSPPIDRARVGDLQAGATADSELARYRDLVILHLGYHTRARRSEQAQYRIDSLEFVPLEDGGEVMVVGKRTSKNDHWSTGKEYEVRDPVAIAVVRRYVELLAEYGQADPEMPLLRGVTKKGGLMPVPESGIGMTGHSVNRAVKRMAVRTPDFDAPEVTSHGPARRRADRPRRAGLQRARDRVDHRRPGVRNPGGKVRQGRGAARRPGQRGQGPAGAGRADDRGAGRPHTGVMTQSLAGRYEGPVMIGGERFERAVLVERAERDDVLGIVLRRGWEVTLETRAAPGGVLASREPDVFGDGPWVVELGGFGPSPLAAGAAPDTPAAGPKAAAADAGAGR